MSDRYWISNSPRLRKESLILLNEYLLSLKLANKAEATIKKYRSILERFLNECPIPLKSLTSEDVLAKPITVDKIERLETKEIQINDEMLSKFQNYLPLLEMLDKNKEKLLEMMMPSGLSDSFPRYIVPGRPSGKTIQMSESLQDMAVEYCNQKNIKQRELFEVALIEFFQKYGYEYEIESLLKSN